MKAHVLLPRASATVLLGENRLSSRLTNLLPNPPRVYAGSSPNQSFYGSPGFPALFQPGPLLRFPRLHSALSVAILATTVMPQSSASSSGSRFSPCHLGFYCPCARQRISQEGTGRPPGRLESQSLPTYPLGYGRMCGKSRGEGRCKSSWQRFSNPWGI